MSAPKLVRCFYKSSEQRIKVYDGTLELNVMETIKRIFNIDASPDRIFLQDGDGDILVFPPVIPDGLCAYVYVQPDFNSPDKERRPQQPEQKALLPGFKWEPFERNQEIDASILKPKNTWSYGISTTEYNEGKLFFKMDIKGLEYYDALIVGNANMDELELPNFAYKPTKGELVYHFANEKSKEFTGFCNIPKAFQIGVLLDFDERTACFYVLKLGKYVLFNKGNLPKCPIKIYAASKELDGTFKILEGGSSKIPELDELDNTMIKIDECFLYTF